ncbi:MAG: type II toxin-antitoxin system HicA family toxin [Acidobacteria bacterium]|nr:type II toxin-antitoxin system HicA family toxin [Acidobacteriota bacterium]
MKLPRDLSGRKLAESLCRNWGYSQVHYVGSHMILETAAPSHQRIAVPSHQALRIGTLNAILRSVAQHKGVTREAIVQSL